MTTTAPPSDDWVIMARLVDAVGVSRRTIYNYVQQEKIKPKEKHGIKLYSISRTKKVLGLE
jgi:predicted DNA-binding transcriptional regulator AlpA